MAGLREILADNMRKNRRRCGLTQEKLAEKANVSTHFIAMIEIGRKYPAPETLERIASALDIEAHELFAVQASSEGDLNWLRAEVLADIERVVGEAVERAVARGGKSSLKTRRD